MDRRPNLSGYPYTSRSINLDGNNLAYIDEGKGQTVVMLHGNPTWSYMYRNLIWSLQKHYRVIAPDHLGCGLSDKPQKYTYHLENHINNLEVLLGKSNVEKCVLIMHDWGGAIGMGWAGRHPEKVVGLVVLNSAAFRSEYIPLRISICRWPLLGPILVRGLNCFARAALFMAVTKKMGPEVAAGYLHPYDSWKNRIGVMRFVEDIPMHENHPSWKTLVEVESNLELLRKRPMLLCWGGKDFCFNDLFYQEWKKRFPDAESFYFKEAGHYVLEDAFPMIMPKIDRFLEKVFK